MISPPISERLKPRRGAELLFNGSRSLKDPAGIEFVLDLFSRHSLIKRESLDLDHER